MGRWATETRTGPRRPGRSCDQRAPMLATRARVSHVWGTMSLVFASSARLRTGILAIVLAAFGGVALVPSAEARAGREPTACMELAVDYARQLVALGDVEPLVVAQAEMLDRLDSIAASAADPFDRLQEAQALLRGREGWALQREIRPVLRVLELQRSIVAGWRGLYCPVARPTGAAGLSGQERCDALAAGFVDRVRIERPSALDTRAREARDVERQTILNAPVTRSERNDLLDLWRVRNESFETLKSLQRVVLLGSAAETLLSATEAEGCINGRAS